jgi:SOS-response transcriptional repressor LexA
MRQVVREEIRRATRPLPPTDASKLLSQLGEWTRPKGSEYLLSGQVNAGPWRDLGDLPEGELLSDYEILEWQESKDLMLKITEDAKDGICLIGDDIYPNDILHFRCGLVPENGEIVVVLGYDVSGTAFGTVKHYYKSHEFIDGDGHGFIELRPSNPECETIQAYEEEIEVRGVLYNHIRRNFRARMQMKRRFGMGVDFTQLGAGAR